jgi:hypothetical protein
VGASFGQRRLALSTLPRQRRADSSGAQASGACAADAIDESIREFCETASARLEACRHPESKRQFLLDYVQRVVYNRYKVTVRGSVPIRSAPGLQSSEASTLAFTIGGEISAGMLYRRLRQKLAEPGRRWGHHCRGLHRACAA